MTVIDRRFVMVLLAGAAGSALLYIVFGTLSAYLAADDFGWLGNALVLNWRHSFIVAGRTHFYRPVVELWFAALTPVCGQSPTCYHAFSLAVHATNVLLFCALAKRASGATVFAVVAAIVFAVLPGYAEAVVWVSAATVLLAGFFWLAAAHVAISAAQRRSAWLWVASAALTGLAMFSHESAASLLLVLPVLLPRASVREIRNLASWRVIGPFAIVGAAFALSVVAVNTRNYVFTEGHYRAGPHMLTHALDYVATLYVGPHRWTGRLLAAALLVVAAASGGRLGRLSAWWIAATLLPYVGFTWGNVGRYLYLPAMGFAMLVAALVLAVEQRAMAGWPRQARAVRALTAIVTIIMLLRFALFTRKAVDEQYRWMEAYRAYSTLILATGRSGPGRDVIIVPPPTDLRVEPPYVAAVARWALHRPLADVVVTNPPAIRPQ